MEKIVNMRDLGGLINQQGQCIKQGKLFRSGNPSVASQADSEKLRKLNLVELVDFRSEQEKTVAEKAFAKQFNWVAQPIFAGDFKAFLLGTVTKTQAADHMCHVYKRFVTDFQKEFHYLLKQAEQGKNLLYHCTAGKDRTGFASFLLLSALGVDDELIMKDYLLSNKAVAALKQQLIDLAKGELADADVLDAVLGVEPHYLEASIAVINKTYGGITHYLNDTLGIDINAIRSHYLES